MSENRPIPPTHAGPVAAAVLSAGIGSACFGICICLSESVPAVASGLTLYKPTGPLSGKVSVGVIAWILAWVLLNRAWKDKQPRFARANLISLSLIVVGLVLSFPTVFDAISHK